MISVLFGTPSWRRISSASTPPSTKNTNVVTRYMIPIFLWSVVVSQSTQRLVWRGRGDLVRDQLGNRAELRISVVDIGAFELLP